MSKVLLYGGGLDSLALLIGLHAIGVKLDLFHLDYGQIAASAERAATVRVAARYELAAHFQTDHSIKLMNPSTPSTMWGDGEPLDDLNPQLNGRNTVAILMAAAKYDNIWLGLDQTPPDVTPFSDCTSDFLTAMSRVLAATYPGRKITLLAPHLQRSKLECYKAALAREPAFFDLAMTCWRPRPYFDNSWKECTVCKHCRGKIAAMNELGLAYTPSVIPEI